MEPVELLETNVEDLARIFREEVTTIWVGAGASVDAGYPDTQALIKQLKAKDNRIPDVGEFYDIVSKAAKLNGPLTICDWLNKAIPARGEPTSFHRSLVRLCKAKKIRQIITTNYDSLIEDTLSQAGIKVHLQVLQGNIDFPPNDSEVHVIKLHGTLTDWLNIVLTTETYQAYENNYPRLRPQIRAIWESSWTIYFGCSMKDPRIQGWLDKLSISEKQRLRPWRVITTSSSLSDLERSSFGGKPASELFEGVHLKFLTTQTHGPALDSWILAADKAAFRYELFVVYLWEGSEQSWAEQSLLPALRAAGVNPVSAVNGLRDPGKDKIEETKRIIQSSQVTLWILGPNSVVGNDLRVHDGVSFPAEPFSGIPFLLSKDLTLPPPVRRAVPISWADPDHHTTEWNRLLEELRAPVRKAPPPRSFEVQRQIRSSRTASVSRLEEPKGSNYLLLSTKSDFTKQLSELLIIEDALGIGYSYGESPKNFEDFKAGLWQFLDSEDKEAKWLFTVQPEDAWSPRLANSEEREILDKLARTGRKIVFFESGQRFLDYGSAPKRNNIFLINTKYEPATRELIRWVVEQHFAATPHRDNRPCAHLVMMHGPSSPAANVRRRTYTEFSTGLLFDHGLAGSEPPFDVQWEELYGPLCKFDLRLTSVILSSWSRDEARQRASDYGGTFGVQSGICRTCFICGNDDIALGALDALREPFDEDIRNGNIAFCGFDGLDAFTSLLRPSAGSSCVRGATAKVDLAKMKDVAIDIVKNMGVRHGTGEIGVPVKEIIASTPIGT